MPCTASTSSAAASRPRTRTRRARLAGAAVAACVALASVTLASAQAPYEPPGDQVMIGFWYDSADPYYDTPSIINQKLGNNVPVFQLSQQIPLPPFNYTTGAGGAAPESLIERSATDAAVFLTIYPTSFEAITDDDFTELGKQILDYQDNLNRTVFLRYAPEMQGSWMTYGFDPVGFLQSWTSMYTIVKAVAPKTIMVWAPNTPQGYPYGQQYTQYSALSAANQALLDTNGNGELDAGDDAFSPYYPGDDLVDWIGLSIYYKGVPSDVQNTLQPDGYCASIITGTDPSDNSVITNWYTNYCANKPEKACMFAEAGAAYHTNHTDGVSQAALQQAWLKDCVTSQTMLDRFPRIKLYMQFEYEKEEDANNGDKDFRDYRILNVTDVRDEFIADLASLSDRFSWAQSRAPPTSISSAGAPAATNSAGSSVIQAITATTRPRPTTFPSLFGYTSDGTQRAEWAELGVMVAAGVVGAWTVMKTL
ncbi:glycoside hydrolase superfamily [Rhodotorula diobovata]|uniref:Glycoside hydrolase superfamily n=1 Tax=Rhodotorula diobovata TaxID=5288 RepID=A0A5C5FMP7_9BASI|nr:glycoside hydrolase superfamily [Rhodotorula diobovata]